MTSYSLLTLLLLLCSAAFAQDETHLLSVNANLPHMSEDTTRPLSSRVNLSLGGNDLPVFSVEELPATPLHVVFVLDNGSHQQRLMSLAKDYVANGAMAIHNSQPTYTVIAAAKDPRTLAETSKAVELRSELDKSSIPAEAGQDESEDLYAGALKAVNILESEPGARVMVILSDDDDDISGKALHSLELKLAASHVRLVSVLLAQHDFFGTKAHSAWGSRLSTLSAFSGGAQYQTDWQNRKTDATVLKALAEYVSKGSIISFKLPPELGVKPGIYFLKARIIDTGRTFRTSPMVVSR